MSDFAGPVNALQSTALIVVLLLAVTANVFLGQTEAPLIVKPFIPKMTRSELLALMIGGMAHISGALMAVYIGMGATAVAIPSSMMFHSPTSCGPILGRIGVGAAYGGAHRVQANAKLVQQGGIQLGAHCRFGAAADEYLAELPCK
jgi:hypothetical protein